VFLFAFAFYGLISIIVNLYDERQADFWQHWTHTATLMLGTTIAAIALPLFAYWVMKGFYKKIQLEINNSNLRYLRGGVRGGILLSDTYVSINYHDIQDIDMEQHFFANRFISIRTLSETHKIILILSEGDKIHCFEAIQEAVVAARKRGPEDRIAIDKI
jgi:hypothetical protein